MSGKGSLGRYGGASSFAGVSLAIALVSALIVAAGAWAWDDLTGQLARYGAYRDLQRNAGRADSLSAAYGALEAELSALGKALPAGNPASHALNALVEEAGKQNLGIGGVTALDEVPFPGYSEWPFDVDLSGNFKDLARYLHGLETQGMAVQVRKMSIRSESMVKSRVKARLEISVFAPSPGAAP